MSSFASLKVLSPEVWGLGGLRLGDEQAWGRLGPQPLTSPGDSFCFHNPLSRPKVSGLHVSSRLVETLPTRKELCGHHVGRGRRWDEKSRTSSDGVSRWTVRSGPIDLEVVQGPLIPGSRYRRVGSPEGLLSVFLRPDVLWGRIKVVYGTVPLTDDRTPRNPSSDFLGS